MKTKITVLNSRFAILAAALSVLLAPVGARAQTSFPSNALLITLTNATQSAAAGSTITFSGSVLNQYTQTVFLNGASATPDDPSLTGDASPFLNNAPASLGVGMSYPTTGAADLFTITIASGANPGAYQGTFSITGGVDGNANDLVGSTPFTVNVAAPEPSQGAAFGLGVIGLGGLVLCARKRQTTV